MRTVLPLAMIATTTLAGPAAADMSAATKRAKSGEFVAKADIRCAQEVGQSLGTCGAAVARAEGSAVVVVTFANGFKRMLMFADGEFQRGNATMSGVGTDTEWTLSEGIFAVRVDDQRFEIPADLVFGD